MDEILSIGEPGQQFWFHLPTQHFVDTRPLDISYFQVVLDNEKLVVVPL